MQLLESAAMCCVAVGQCPWLGLQGLYVRHGGRILVDVFLEYLGTLLPSVVSCLVRDEARMRCTPSPHQLWLDVGQSLGQSRSYISSW
jgi:hypothetical protein